MIGQETDRGIHTQIHVRNNYSKTWNLRFILIINIIFKQFPGAGYAGLVLTYYDCTCVCIYLNKALIRLGALQTMEEDWSCGHS